MCVKLAFSVLCTLLSVLPFILYNERRYNFLQTRFLLNTWAVNPGHPHCLSYLHCVFTHPTQEEGFIQEPFDCCCNAGLIWGRWVGESVSMAFFNLRRRHATVATPQHTKKTLFQAECESHLQLKHQPETQRKRNIIVATSWWVDGRIFQPLWLPCWLPIGPDKEPNKATCCLSAAGNTSILHYNKSILHSYA